jgi:hypothetical protein
MAKNSTQRSSLCEAGERERTGIVVSVYVDDARISYGRMKMSHMIADDHLELLSMACRIGVPSKWIQKRGTYQEHFDICMTMRSRAIERGAIELSQKELVAKLKERRPCRVLRAPSCRLLGH